MKTKILAFSLIAMSFGTLASGQDKGNGGGAFVCRDSKAKISRAVFYDLWDATEIERHGRTDYKTQLHEALLRIRFYNSSLYDVFVAPLAEIVTSKIEAAIAEGINARLATVSDFSPLYLPPVDFCPEQGQLAQFETAVHYKDGLIQQTGDLEERVLINSKMDRAYVAREIVEGFETQTDRAALYAHEIIYKLNRAINGHKLSDDSKAIVALLFSKRSPSKDKQLYALLDKMFSDEGMGAEGHKYGGQYVTRLRMINFASTTKGQEVTDEVFGKFISHSAFSKGQEFKIPLDVLTNTATAERLDSLLSDAIRTYNTELVRYLVENEGVDLSQTITG